MSNFLEKEDAVLLKLHRTYGKDEAIKYLFDEISSLRFKIGELKSENAELIYQNNIIRGVKQWSKDEYILELKSIIKSRQKVNSKLQKEIISLRNKYIGLILKNNIK